MGDAVIRRLGGVKALLGIVAGAGASYGIYRLLSGGASRGLKAGPPGEAPGEDAVQPGSLLARVSGLDVLCPRTSGGAEEASAGTTSSASPLF